LAHVVLLEGFRATLMYERGHAPFKARDSGMIGPGMRSQVFWPLLRHQKTTRWSPVSGDFVAKLDDRPLARNNRILAHKILDQHCALAPALESMLLVLAQKIVLQHNRG
jgi:hypothetical protein